MARIQKVKVIIRGMNDELVEEIVQIPEYITPDDWLCELLEGYSAYVVLNHTSYRKAEIVKVIPIYDQPEARGSYEGVADYGEAGLRPDLRRKKVSAFKQS